MKKLGIIFGGKSDEHEVSILSASSVISAIDTSKYEIVQIGISKDGNWFQIADEMDNIKSLDDERVKTLIPSDEKGRVGAKRVQLGDFKNLIDFAFPVLHGPFGEDGTIQGMFEMLDVPYAGCGVTSSALSMDKIFTKEMWIRAGLPVCKHRNVKARDMDSDGNNILKDIEKDLEYPLFVKPANMGSSVGISKVNNISELEKGIKNALLYDTRVIIEEGINGREIETAILGNNVVQAAAVGEIVTSGKFYDYESKYKDGNTQLFIPADIPSQQTEQIRNLAIEAFKVLDGSGFARVDFFIDEDEAIYLNEMNTIPGFTKYSMFPALWQEAGVEYKDLIERIIGLGYERYNAKNNR